MTSLMALDAIEFGPIQPMQLSEKDKQAIASLQATAPAAQEEYEAKLAALGMEMTVNFVKTLDDMIDEAHGAHGAHGLEITGGQTPTPLQLVAMNELTDL